MNSESEELQEEKGRRNARTVVTLMLSVTTSFSPMTLMVTAPSTRYVIKEEFLTYLDQRLKKQVILELELRILSNA